ncbi:hypothetical protein L9F63_019966, partial [Diploptera punctata]
EAMVFLKTISSIYERCFCCKRTQKTSSEVVKNVNQLTNQQNKATETFQDNIWTTDIVSYDAMATITAVEAMSSSRTGIINHNFQPPGKKRIINLPDITADTSKFCAGTMTTHCPQDLSPEGEQYFHRGKTTQDSWYFSGSFTEDPRKSKEVTEL